MIDSAKSGIGGLKTHGHPHVHADSAAQPGSDPPDVADREGRDLNQAAQQFTDLLHGRPQPSTEPSGRENFFHVTPKKPMGSIREKSASPAQDAPNLQADSIRESPKPGEKTLDSTPKHQATATENPIAGPVERPHVKNLIRGMNYGSFRQKANPSPLSLQNPSPSAKPVDHVSVQTPPPNPLPQGEGEYHNLLFRKTPSLLVGEGLGGGGERLLNHYKESPIPDPVEPESFFPTEHAYHPHPQEKPNPESMVDKLSGQRPFPQKNSHYTKAPDPDLTVNLSSLSARKIDDSSNAPVDEKPHRTTFLPLSEGELNTSPLAGESRNPGADYDAKPMQPPSHLPSPLAGESQSERVERDSKPIQPSGDRILQGLLGQPVFPTAPPPLEPPPRIADHSDRTDQLAERLAQRILVSDRMHTTDSEVRIQLRESILQGSEITLRREEGQLIVKFNVPDSTVAQELLLQTDGLQHILATRLDESVRIEVHLAPQNEGSQGQPGDGRSRNRRDLHESWSAGD